MGTLPLRTFELTLKGMKKLVLQTPGGEMCFEEEETANSMT